MFQLTLSDGIVRVADDALIPPDDGNRDWREYQTWIAAGNQPDPVADTPPPAVPENVQAGSFMRALFEFGWYADVDAAAQKAGGLALILWQRAPIFERHHPMVIQIAGAIGKNDADLDRLFLLAGTY